MQGSDYESVRDLAIHCKKEGVNLEDLVSALRIKNYIKQINEDEERVEQFIIRIIKCKDVLPLAEQIMRVNIGIGEM